MKTHSGWLPFDRTAQYGQMHSGCSANICGVTKETQVRSFCIFQGAALLPGTELPV